MTATTELPCERLDAAPPNADDADHAHDAADVATDAAPSPPDRTIRTERAPRVAIGVGAIAASAAAAGAAFLASRFLRSRDRRAQTAAPTPRFQLGSLGAEAAVSLLDRAIDERLRNADVARADASPPSDGSAAHPHRGTAVATARDGRAAQLDWSLWWTGRAWSVAIAIDGEPYVDAIALDDLYERLCARLSRASALVIRSELARCATARAKPARPTIDV